MHTSLGIEPLFKVQGDSLDDSSDLGDTETLGATYTETSTESSEIAKTSRHHANQH